VYLYRDRSDGSSISRNADAHATVLYLQQELACARLVASRPALRQQHAEMVFDADGWAHLARFVASGPSDDDVVAVDDALTELVEALPIDALDEAAPARRVLWTLALSGRWSAARRFVTAVQAGDELGRLDAWRSALLTLHADGSARTALGSLVDQGLIPTLVNDAEAVPLEWLERAVREFRTLPSSRNEPGLRSAMADAVARADAETVATVSALRRVVPLVVLSAVPTAIGLEVSGSLPIDRPLVLARPPFRAGRTVCSRDHDVEFMACDLRGRELGTRPVERGSPGSRSGGGVPGRDRPDAVAADRGSVPRATVG
jgi:hypothetical protein